MAYKTPFATTTDWGSVQVGSGLSVTDGIISASTPVQSNFGFFYDTTNQTNPIASTPNLVTYNVTAVNNQVTVVGGTNVTVANAGTYRKVFTVSLQKTNAGAPTTTSLWLRRNGVDIADSRQDIQVPNQTSLLFVTGSYTLNLAAGDFLQMVWSSPDTAIQLSFLPATVGPVRPAISSAKITLSTI